MTQEKLLTSEQLKAVQTYAANNGRQWKRLLNHAWMTGDYQVEDDSASLQQIRNSFGPSWLVRFRLPQEPDGLEQMRGLIGDLKFFNRVTKNVR